MAGFQVGDRVRVRSDPDLDIAEIAGRVGVVLDSGSLVPPDDTGSKVRPGFGERDHLVRLDDNWGVFWIRAAFLEPERRKAEPKRRMQQGGFDWVPPPPVEPPRRMQQETLPMALPSHVRGQAHLRGRPAVPAAAGPYYEQEALPLGGLTTQTGFRFDRPRPAPVTAEPEPMPSNSPGKWTAWRDLDDDPTHWRREYREGRNGDRRTLAIAEVWPLGANRYAWRVTLPSGRVFGAAVGDHGVAGSQVGAMEASEGVTTGATQQKWRALWLEALDAERGVQPSYAVQAAERFRARGPRQPDVPVPQVEDRAKLLGPFLRLHAWMRSAANRIDEAATVGRDLDFNVSSSGSQIGVRDYNGQRAKIRKLLVRDLPAPPPATRLDNLSSSAWTGMLGAVRGAWAEAQQAAVAIPVTKPSGGMYHTAPPLRVEQALREAVKPISRAMTEITSRPRYSDGRPCFDPAYHAGTWTMGGEAPAAHAPALVGPSGIRHTLRGARQPKVRAFGVDEARVMFAPLVEAASQSSGLLEQLYHRYPRKPDGPEHWEHGQRYMPDNSAAKVRGEAMLAAFKRLRKPRGVPSATEAESRYVRCWSAIREGYVRWWQRFVEKPTHHLATLAAMGEAGPWQEGLIPGVEDCGRVWNQLRMGKEPA